MFSSVIESDVKWEIQRHRGIRLAVCGVILQVGGPFVGFVSTAFLMTRTFASLAGETDQQIHQQALSSTVNLAMNLTGIGLLACLLGWVLILIAVIGLRNRTRWLYQWLVVGCISQLILVPVGTMFSMFMLLYLTRHHHEFVSAGNHRNKLLRSY